MYLIQQTTKQSTDEILGFFYDLGKEIFIVGIKNMKPNQRDIRKNIEALYPGTNIPFWINVEGGKRSYWDDDEDEQDDGKRYGGTIKVQFPNNPSYMDTEELMTMIMEQTLLGTTGLADFEAPPSKTPKMYKDLINQVLKGKKDETIRDS